MTERHKVLVVGTGSIGERHTRCFGLTGRAEVGVCEVNDARRQAVAERYGVRAFATLEQGLVDRPELVVIATPAHLHIAMARQAVSNGCHVLIEKPLSISTTGIAELSQLIGAKGVHAGIAYVYRSHPSLTAMRTALQSGRFGKPLHLVANSGQHFPFYRPAYRETYYTRHETGGGAVQDALTHIVNAVEWLVGPTRRLVADAAHQSLAGVTIEDTVDVLTRHGDVLGCLSLNQYQAPNENSLTVVCERGTIRFEGHHQRWGWQTTPDGNWEYETSGPMERDTMFIAQAKQFLDVVEGKASPLCTLAEAKQTLLVNLAILASVESGTWQTVGGS